MEVLHSVKLDIPLVQGHQYALYVLLVSSVVKVHPVGKHVLQDIRVLLAVVPQHLATVQLEIIGNLDVRLMIGGLLYAHPVQPSSIRLLLMSKHV